MFPVINYALCLWNCLSDCCVFFSCIWSDNTFLEFMKETPKNTDGVSVPNISSLLCGVEQRSFGIVKDTQFIKMYSKWCEFKAEYFSLLRNVTTALLFKTTPVRYRPSRWVHWWAGCMTISISRTWQLIWHIFLQKFSVWGCVSLPNVWNTLLSE
jgi:hypothetical protein